MTKASLLVVQGSDQGTRFPVNEQPVTVGRGVRNEIRLLDTEVSRRHATCKWHEGQFVVEDLKSSNGTFVNGRKISRKVLKNGDQLRIGRSVFLFTHVESETLPGSVAERIDLLHQEADQRSSIVGSVEHDAGDTLLREAQAQSKEEVARSLDNLRTLYRLSEELVQPVASLEHLLKRILTLTLTALGADRGCILLDEAEASSQLTPRAVAFRDPDAAGDDRMPVSRSIVDYVVQHNHGVHTSDARRDERFQSGESILRAGIREAMCVPMQGLHTSLGVIYVDITTPEHTVLAQNTPRQHFSEGQLRLLAAIGRQAAFAVETYRYQSALLKAERLGAIGQTIAMLSHHIKNILQGVRGGSYLIDMGLGKHEEDLVRRGWTIVEKNQNKIYNLVMDMLTYSKERQPDLELCNLNETMADLAELMEARAEECEVRFECKLAAEMPESSYDAEGIHRAVLNIVTNAIDAVEGTEKAAVRVETGYEPTADSVYVAVTDNGPGIPPDQLDRIFQLFESTKGSRGTGLGLAVSRKILREHGGDIRVESQPGAGSRFVLAWPRADEEHRHEESPTQA